MTSLLNLYRKYFLNRYRSRLSNDILSGTLDFFLETLLKLMRLAFLVDPDYRRNIEGFNAKIAFASKDGEIGATAVFAKNKMKVRRDKVEDATVTLYFKDGRSLMNFVFSDNRDIASAVIDRVITYEGNMNYLLKFVYMATHLALQFGLRPV